MSASVVAFPIQESTAARDALYAAVAELQALISIDPVLGASPVRVCFIFNPEAKARIAAFLPPSDGAGARATTAYGLVAYDFSFALHLFVLAGSGIPLERAKQIICRSAELQGGLLREAAAVSGVAADPIPHFDAEALKASFFPGAQERVIHLFRLRLPTAGSGGRSWPTSSPTHQVGYCSPQEARPSRPPDQPPAGAP